MRDQQIYEFVLDCQGDEYVIRRRRDVGIIVFGPRGGYRVTELGDACSCPGWIYGATRGELSICRHMHMVALVLEWLRQRRQSCPQCCNPLTRPGRGRCYGEHPDLRYCAGCSFPTYHYRAA